MNGKIVNLVLLMLISLSSVSAVSMVEFSDELPSETQTFSVLPSAKENEEGGLRFAEKLEINFVSSWWFRLSNLFTIIDAGKISSKCADDLYEIQKQVVDSNRGKRTSEQEILRQVREAQASTRQGCKAKRTQAYWYTDVQPVKKNVAGKEVTISEKADKQLESRVDKICLKIEGQRRTGTKITSCDRDGIRQGLLKDYCTIDSQGNCKNTEYEKRMNGIKKDFGMTDDEFKSTLDAIAQNRKEPNPKKWVLISKTEELTNLPDNTKDAPESNIGGKGEEQIYCIDARRYIKTNGIDSQEFDCKADEVCSDGKCIKDTEGICEDVKTSNSCKDQKILSIGLCDIKEKKEKKEERGCKFGCKEDKCNDIIAPKRPKKDKSKSEEILRRVKSRVKR